MGERGVLLVVIGKRNGVSEKLGAEFEAVGTTTVKEDKCLFVRRAEGWDDQGIWVFGV